MAPNPSQTQNGVVSEDVGKRCEIRLLQERFNPKSGNAEIVAKDDYNPLDYDPNVAYALVTRQVFDKDNVLIRTTLRINSPNLLHVFKNVVKFYPSMGTDFDEPFDIENPFEMLYHHWSDLEAYQRRSTDDVTSMHLNLLLDYMQAEMGQMKINCERMVKRGFIQYKLLWTIFRPGQLQCVSNHGHPRLLRLERTAYEEYQNKGPVFEVYCTYVDYDGTNVGKARMMVEIRQKSHFAAFKPGRITTLGIIPRAFVVGQDDLEDRLSARGRRFLSFRGVQLVQYDGLYEYLRDLPSDFYHPSMAEWEGVWLPKTESGRVIIDAKTFTEECAAEQVEIQLSKADQGAIHQLLYACKNESKQSVDSLKAIGATTEDNDEELEPFLCPAFVFGYSLQHKLWCRFYIDCIEAPKWKTNAEETLLLPDHQKKVLMALVKSHSFPDKPRDQAELKGKGLVALLHGSAGSGKTLSAETAAEVSRKGLLKISLGEIVSHGYIYEEKLEQFLRYASTWRTIVLIDEADVFLEGRQSGPAAAVNRNAIVATFLRYLEYFQGIIFLTSNRIEVLDPAIKSRIHIALQYSPPNVNMRRSLWRQNLLAIKPADRDVDTEEVLNLVENTEMNGREISNTLNTAQTLARHEKQKLTQQHIEVVLQVWKDFDVSLQNLEQLRKVKPRSDTLISSARQDSLVVSSGPSHWLPIEE